MWGSPLYPKGVLLRTCETNFNFLYLLTCISKVTIYPKGLLGKGLKLLMYLSNFDEKGKK